MFQADQAIAACRGLGLGDCWSASPRRTPKPSRFRGASLPRRASSEYAIELLGASGGNSSGNKGGLGAEVEAEEFIAAGFSFDLFVGQMGFGGGGGRFIVSGNVIVFAAGGGGGPGVGDGGPGQAGTDGQAGYGLNGGSGGVTGNGGGGGTFLSIGGIGANGGGVFTNGGDGAGFLSG